VGYNFVADSEGLSLYIHLLFTEEGSDYNISIHTYITRIHTQ